MIYEYKSLARKNSLQYEYDVLNSRYWRFYYVKGLSRTMIHAQAPNQSTSLKSGLIFDRFVLFCFVRTDTITRNNEPLFKLVLWFVLGRGSIENPTKCSKNTSSFNIFTLDHNRNSGTFNALIFIFFINDI